MNGKKAKQIRKFTLAMNPGPNFKKLYRLFKKAYKRGRASHLG